jgi:hypothetical protein
MGCAKAAERAAENLNPTGTPKQHTKVLIVTAESLDLKRVWGSVSRKSHQKLTPPRPGTAQDALAKTNSSFTKL